MNRVLMVLTVAALVAVEDGVPKARASTATETISVGWDVIPSPTRLYVECNFSVSAAGGVPPYHYAWTQNSNPVGTDSPAITLNTGPSSFTLAVTVTDSEDDEGGTSYPVTVSSSSPFDCVY